MPDFARPFLIRRYNGQVLQGVQFASGRVVVDAPMGVYTAVSVDELIAEQPARTRIEWAEGEEHTDA